MVIVLKSTYPKWRVRCTAYFTLIYLILSIDIHNDVLFLDLWVGYLSALHEKYGPIVKLWLGPTQLLVSVKDVAVIKEMLITAKDKLPLTGRAFRLAFGRSNIFVSSFEKVYSNNKAVLFFLDLIFLFLFFSHLVISWMLMYDMFLYEGCCLCTFLPFHLFHCDIVMPFIYLFS